MDSPVVGFSAAGDGVSGRSTSGFGVFGASSTGVGIRAVAEKDGGPALQAEAKGNGFGVVAKSDGSGDGVFGTSATGIGVHGFGSAGDGVLGISATGIGVHGVGGKLAGFFEGDVSVTGKVHCPTSTITCFEVSLSNGDCAEEFELAPGSSAEPGTVMVLGSESSLRESADAYDKRVAGVISGAGSYKPGIVLDRNGQGNRIPVALLGKVFCKADAQFGSIGVGDLLTTSPTPGYAMRVDDDRRAFGAVIGKALRPLDEGQGLIPILIALQ